MNNTHQQELCAEFPDSTSAGPDVIPDRPASLPYEWLYWIAENRLGGITDERILEIVSGAGFARPAVMSAIEGMQRDPTYMVANHIAQRLKKVGSFLDVRRSLGSLVHGSEKIERLGKISQQKFLERYYVANRPVILTGLLEGSKAYERWTPEYIAEASGEVSVQIMKGRHADPRYEQNSESHKCQVRMADYVRMVLAGGPSNDYYLVANNGFFNLPETQGLLAETPALEDYLDPLERRGRVFFWFGPAGTVTPLHHDIMNIIVAEVRGRKRFILFPPEKTIYLYNKVSVYSDVNCQEPDYSRHPLYQYANPIEVVIEPGEVLFIPVGWWHNVEALDTSIMISYINFRFPNSYDWFHPDIS